MKRLVLLVALVGCGAESDAPPEIALNQSAALLTHVGDTTVAHADGNVTWQSSNPEAVSVDADGTITALVPVGSSQITAMIDDTVSKPMLVVVAQPADNAVLVSDAQVLDGPTPIDPDAAVALGYRVHVTLADTVAVAPGSIVLARESKPIAGRVVSANGGDVVLELVDLPQLFHKLSVDSSHRIDQAVFDASLDAKPRVDFVEKKIGPFDCKISGSANAITGEASLKMEPDLVFAQRVRHDDQGEVSSITAMLNGSITTTGTASLKFTPTFGLGATCKVNLATIPLPFGGPVSVIAGFQIALGLRGEISGQLQSPALEAGFEIKQTSQITVGFTYTPETGLSPTVVPTTNIAGKLKYMMGNGINDQANVVIALGPTVGLEAGLHLPLLAVKKLSLIEAFLSLRAEGLFAFPLVQLTDSSSASKYEAKMQINVGPGSDARSALEFFGGFGSINPTVKVEAKLARSPTGKLKATRSDVRVGDSIELIVLLDDQNLDFFGIRNIDEVRIYHASANHLEPELLATLPAASVVTYEWKPAGTEITRHTFWAAVTTKLAPGIPLEVTEDSHVQIEVKPPATPWTFEATWTGHGESFSAGEDSSGTSTRHVTMTTSGGSKSVQNATTPQFFDEVEGHGTFERIEVTTFDPVVDPFHSDRCWYRTTTTRTATANGVTPQTPPGSLLQINEGPGTYVIVGYEPPNFSINEHEVRVETLKSGPATCLPTVTTTSDIPGAGQPDSFQLHPGTFTPDVHNTITDTLSVRFDLSSPPADYTYTYTLSR